MKTDTSLISPLEQSVLDSALAEQNTNDAIRLTHSLKSTSANVGAIPLSELAKSLEALAHQDKLDDVRAQMNELSQLFDLTRASVEQLAFMQS